MDNRPENLVVMSFQEHAALHNQKHPLTKVCEVCRSVFTPAATKRARAKTCGRPECRLTAIGQNQKATEWIEAHGEKLSLRAWSARTGIKMNTIRWRLRRGWPVERALTPQVAEVVGRVVRALEEGWRP